ncbi:uncharacterized protein LOC117121936 [Anneissia japonica]|uniref:uncharacterized protein LOC117121936 n=1 Tax=Anneissia japonica TaxID=1529436 RepID=UPI001425BAED|nr:uncharacterized protein LOC117121936 [Anneissia japonica]
MIFSELYVFSALLFSYLHLSLCFTPPVAFLEPPMDISIKEGETASMTCGLNQRLNLSQTAEHLAWYKVGAGGALTRNNDVYSDSLGNAKNRTQVLISGSASRFTLIIAEVTVLDAGEYFCVVFSRGLSVASNHAILRVQRIIKQEIIPTKATEAHQSRHPSMVSQLIAPHRPSTLTSKTVKTNENNDDVNDYDYLDSKLQSAFILHLMADGIFFFIIFITIIITALCLRKQVANFQLIHQHLHFQSDNKHGKRRRFMSWNGFSHHRGKKRSEYQEYIKDEGASSEYTSLNTDRMHRVNLLKENNGSSSHTVEMTSLRLPSQHYHSSVLTDVKKTSTQ